MLLAAAGCARAYAIHRARGKRPVEMFVIERVKRPSEN